MIQDQLDPINALNMPELADTTLAMDFLIQAKSAVRNTAAALTEAASPEARRLLREQLREALAMHGEITELMIRKQWFHPFEPREQYKLDQLSANNAATIARMNLFPGDTSRRGLFDRLPDRGKEESRV